MSELRDLLQELTVASDPMGIEHDEDTEFLEKHRDFLRDLLIGLQRIGAINASNLHFPTPSNCTLCYAYFDPGDYFIKGYAYWGRGDRRLKGWFRPVAMCLDCNSECGAAIGPDAALYSIDKHGRSRWIAGQHKFTPARRDGGKLLVDPRDRGHVRERPVNTGTAVTK